MRTAQNPLVGVAYSGSERQVQTPFIGSGNKNTDKLKKWRPVRPQCSQIDADLTIGAAAQAETLRVGMECTYAPFNFKKADGTLDDYDVDVAKGVAEILGADLEFVCQKWDGMIPALLANKFDLVVASMSITDSRLE